MQPPFSVESPRCPACGFSCLGTFVGRIGNMIAAFAALAQSGYVIVKAKRDYWIPQPTFQR